MEEVIAVHVLNYLKEDDPLNDFTEDTKYCNRPIVLGQQRIIFLEKRNNFGFLVQRRKVCLLNRKVDNMSDYWQDIIYHEFDDVGVNSVNSRRFAFLKLLIKKTDITTPLKVM